MCICVGGRGYKGRGGDEGVSITETIKKYGISGGSF